MARQASLAEIRAVLAAADSHDGPLARVGPISAALVGSPYIKNPLGGGPGQREALVTRLDGFDCVTFFESVFALALCDEPADFPDRLQALRYLNGRVAWRDRNHYAVQWIRRNRQAGFALMTDLPGSVRTGRTRTLDVVPGAPTVRWKVAYVPCSAVDQLARSARAGDLVASVSEQEHLDVFHTGLLFPNAPLPNGRRGLILRHASESRGVVVDEPIEEYIARAPSPGFVVARLRRPRARSWRAGGIA